MPSQCSQLKQDLADIKLKAEEFNRALDGALSSGDLSAPQRLKTELETMMASLKEKLWPFRELSRPELTKQYESQKEIFQKTGILEQLSSGEWGIKAIDNKEYPFPEIRDIFKMMKENKEILKTKIEQGFTQLLITPFGMKLDDLAEKYKQTILEHHRAGKLFATKKNRDDPNEPLIPLELDENEPLWKWEKYSNADVSGELLYDPEQLPTTSEEPDEKKRRRKSKGRTKKDILSGGAGPEGQAYGAGWDIRLIEDLPNIPRATNDEEEKQKRIKKGGRPQLDTAGSSIKKYIKKGEDIPSPQEYLKALQNEPIYQHEQGMTPEDQLTYAILHLEQTNQTIDDWQGNGSVSYQLRAYLPASGYVPLAYWRRDRRRASLSGDGPGDRGGVYGVRGSVRVKKA